MGFTSDHWVYQKVCVQLFARKNLIVGNVSPKPLAHEIGTSIVPVREALIRLAAQNVVDWIPSKGIYLSELRGNLVASLYQDALNIATTSPPVYAATFDGAQLLSNRPRLYDYHFDKRFSPESTKISAEDCLSFDRFVLEIFKNIYSPSQISILTYIWIHTMRFRYFLYKNFSVYLHAVKEELDPQTELSPDKSLPRILDYYSKSAANAADLASSRKRASPFM